MTIVSATSRSMTGGMGSVHSSKVGKTGVRQDGSGGSESLEEGEVHLWYTFVGDADDAHAAAYAPLLPEEERARRDRFVFARHRTLFQVAHGFLRTTLSRYAPIDPADWQFTSGEYGKPHIANAGVDLTFNLSHSEGIAVCAIARGAAVGVDVEPSIRSADHLGVGERFFAAPEFADVARRDTADVARTFVHYWTLKESYIKACGGGLSIALDTFAFTPPEVIPPAIRFLGRDDDPSHWQFFAGDIGGAFRIAAALHTPSPMRVRIDRVPSGAGETA